MKIILLGPPGAGKGTQSAFIKEILNIPSVSTGAIIRSEISEGTELGKAAEQFISEGKLLTDELVNQLALSRISKDDCRNGFILDGYPRTVNQAEALEKAGVDIDIALLFDVSDDEIVTRLSGRRECSKCGQIYNQADKPPVKEGMCDTCGSLLSIRADDKPEIILNRLRVYHTETEPIVDFYRKKGKLEIVNNAGALEENKENTIAIIKEKL